MATYVCSAQLIKRSEGRSATAAAAYRAGERIEDERSQQTHDYSARSGVVHTEIIAPDHAPDWAHDRIKLWNAAEKAERRKDAQVAREILFSLPHELTHEQQRDLLRAYSRDQFAARGMVADLAIHEPHRDGDKRNHHAHVMLTMREFDGEQFAATKQRDWNKTEQLKTWRREWADYANRALERAGIEARIDHRSLVDQGIDREPEPKLGPMATQMEREGRRSHAGDDLRAVWERNAEREAKADRADALNLDIAQERLKAAQEALRQRQEHRDTQELFARQRGDLERQAAEQRAQIEALSAQLEGRGRFAVFWDKVRGRLGWDAEKDLAAQRQQLDITQERQGALERAQATYSASYDTERTHEAEPERQFSHERDTARDDFDRAASPYEDQLTHEDYVDMFREAGEGREAEHGRDSPGGRGGRSLE